MGCIFGGGDKKKNQLLKEEKQKMQFLQARSMIFMIWEI